MNITNLIRTRYNDLGFYMRMKYRDLYIKRDLEKRKRTVQFKGLSLEQKEEVKDYWNSFGITKFDIDWIDFYCTCFGTFEKKFIPDDLYFTKIEPCFSDSEACKYIDDKNLYSMLFKDVNMPKTIARKINGIYLDEMYLNLSYENVLKKCTDCGNVILKPSVSSSGGSGIFFWNSSDEMRLLEDALNKIENCVIQEIVEQHPILNKLHKDSLNTIRIISLVFNQKVYILSSFLRMGANGSKVDNVSSGGMFCGLTPNGQLKKEAFYEHGKKVLKHPQGAVFSEYKIPNYEKCLSIIEYLAYRIMRFSNLVSWDFSIDALGNPVLIEANMNFGGMFPHQMANGPLFGEITDDVLSDIFKK